MRNEASAAIWHSFKQGNWVNEKQSMLTVVSDQQTIVKALVAEADIKRISRGANGLFLSDNPLDDALKVKLLSVAPASDNKISELVLADHYGGPIPSQLDNGEVKVRQGWFEITFLGGLVGTDKINKGVVNIRALAVSPASLLWRQIAKLIVREQGG